MPENHIKIAKTKYPVAERIKNRWSPYSFANREISYNDINTIVEAGSWSFSSSNHQPWRLIVARKDNPNFMKIWECLSEGNKIWTKNASVLMVGLAKKTLEHQPEVTNRWAEHDLGAFSAMMILQATSMGIIAHPMGGFSPKHIIESFRLHDDLTPLTVIALGYLDSPDLIPEPFKTRDLTERNRKDISEIIIL